MQPLGLKALVEKRFPRNQSATKTQPHEKQGATPATKTRSKSCTTDGQLRERIILMAKRWDYTPEELTWALSQSKIKPREWSLVCTADEKLICI